MFINQQVGDFLGRKAPDRVNWHGIAGVTSVADMPWLEALETGIGTHVDCWYFLEVDAAIDRCQVVNKEFRFGMVMDELGNRWVVLQLLVHHEGPWVVLGEQGVLQLFKIFLHKFHTSGRSNKTFDILVPFHGVFELLRGII